MASSAVGTLRRYHLHEVRVKDAKLSRTNVRRHLASSPCLATGLSGSTPLFLKQQ